MIAKIEPVIGDAAADADIEQPERLRQDSALADFAGEIGVIGVTMRHRCSGDVPFS